MRFCLWTGSHSAKGQHVAEVIADASERAEAAEGRQRPKAEHNAMLDEICAGVPAEHLSWLKDQPAWSNHLVLAQRIEFVLSACPNVAARIVGTDDAPLTLNTRGDDESETAAEAFVLTM